MDVVTSHPIMCTEMIDPDSSLNVAERWFVHSKLLCRPAILGAKGTPETHNQNLIRPLNSLDFTRLKRLIPETFVAGDILLNCPPGLHQLMENVARSELIPMLLQ